MKIEKYFKTYKDIDRAYLDYDCELDGIITEQKEEIRPQGFGILYKYKLILELFIEFQANDITYESQLKDALKNFKYQLFDEILCDLKMAISSTNNKETKRILNNIFNKIIK